MNDVNIDRILENMFNIMLIIHKKILRMDLGLETDNLSRLHMAVMGLLNTSNMTMTELAKALMMVKPQLTHLVETLVALGLVERLSDAKDRRVINLALTQKGRVLLEEMKSKVKENTKNRLATLTSEELTQMSTALETLRNIVGKL
jgi:DNA-binding MarR family transcriptional regulator